MKNGLFTFLLITIFLYSGFLYSQEKTKLVPKPSPSDNKEKVEVKPSSPKDAKDKKEEVKSPDSEKQTKEEEPEPSRYETGTVQIDSKLVASNYRTLSLKLLKTLKSSLEPWRGRKIQKLVDSYTKASVDYQKRDFVMARRKFEKNYKDINISCEPLTQKYQEVYLKLFSENIQSVVDLKVNSSMTPEYIAVLEKYLNTAGQFHTSAESSINNKDYVEGISFYKKSIFNLIKLSYLLQKDKLKDLLIKEKFAQGFLIEDDYIPKEYINFYDDSIDLIHKEREKEREEEKLQAKKALMEKYNLKEENKESPKEKDSAEKDKVSPEEKGTPIKEIEKTSKRIDLEVFIIFRCFMIIELHPQNPEARKLKQISDALKDGGVFIFPTDTVYGLIADSQSKKGVEKLYELKEIDKNKPLSLLCLDISTASEYIENLSNSGFRIMKKLTPGPYTFILKANKNLPRVSFSNHKNKNIGIRIPEHKFIMELLKTHHGTVTSTSVTTDDEFITNINDLEQIYGKRVDGIIDGGIIEVEPSTIINLTSDEISIIRQGKGYSLVEEIISNL